MCYSSNITEQTADGRILKSYDVSLDCYYVGTARGGISEYGMMSLSTCGDEIVSLAPWYCTVSHKPCLIHVFSA